MNLKHNEEIAKAIEGSWQLTTESKAEMHPDQENLEYVLGVLTYKTNNIMTFKAEQEVETEIIQEGISFEFVGENAENYGYTEADLLKSANLNMVVYGNYISSEDALVIKNREVSFNGGEKIPFDQAVAMNPSLGQAKQTIEWKPSADTLTFIQEVNGQPMNVDYKRK